jgi:hypothetical protein
MHSQQALLRNAGHTPGLRYCILTDTW